MLTVVEWNRPETLFEKQRDALFCEARFCITEGSVKSGKSSGALCWITEKAIEADDGSNLWWISPTYALSAEMFRRLKRLLPAEVIERTNETSLSVTLVTGATVWFKSADRDQNLYGSDVVALVIDEAARIPERSWFAARSTLSATGGPARLLTNVAGRSWAWTLARDAESGTLEGWNYHRLDWRDSVEAGIVDIAEVEAARRSLPGSVFQMLYESKVSDDMAQMFDTSKIEILESEPEEVDRIIRSWDLATSLHRGSSYTVGLLVARDGDKYVIADLIRGRWTADEVVDRVRAAAISDGKGTLQLIEEEKGSSGRLLIESLGRDLPQTAGPVEAAQISGDKIVRAYQASAVCGRGDLSMVAGEWNAAVVAELDAFPAGDADITDALSHAVIRAESERPKTYPAASIHVPTQRVPERAMP